LTFLRPFKETDIKIYEGSVASAKIKHQVLN